MHRVWWLGVVCGFGCWLVTATGYCDDGALVPEAQEALGEFQSLVDQADQTLLDECDQQIGVAAKSGDLDEVKNLMAQKEAFESQGTLPTSSRLKSAVARYKSSLKGGFEKTRLSLESCIKSQTKQLAIDKAEQVQVQLNAHLKWSGVIAPAGTSTHRTRKSNSKLGSNETSSLFKVNSATWGFHEMFKPGYVRKEATEDFSKRLLSGEEFAVNEATYGVVLPTHPFLAMKVEFQLESQKLSCMLSQGTQLKLVNATVSKEPVWKDGPLQMISATWGLADGTHTSDCLPKFKEVLKTKGRVTVGYHDFGEIESGKSKAMIVKLQARDKALELRLAEPSQIEIVSEK